MTQPERPQCHVSASTPDLDHEDLGPTWSLTISPDNVFTADVDLGDHLIDLCCSEQVHGYEAAARLDLNAALTLLAHLKAGTDSGPVPHDATGVTLMGSTLTVLDVPFAGTFTFTPDQRAQLTARLTTLTDLLRGPPAFHLSRHGETIQIADDRRRLLVQTDDAGAMALVQLARAAVRAESNNLRSRHCHERVHTLPGPDGALVITRRDAMAFMEDGESDVIVDAHITLRTRAERLHFVHALNALLPQGMTEFSRPEDEIWSTH